MLAGRLVRCRNCRLLWHPQGMGAAVCPACGAKKPLRMPEPFHAGVLLVGIGLLIAMGASPRSDAARVEPPQQASAPPAVRAEPTAPKPKAPRAVAVGSVKPDKVKTRVTAGPRRGDTVTLRRGDRVRVLRRDGSEVLVRDDRGNEMWVEQQHVAMRR